MWSTRPGPSEQFNWSGCVCVISSLNLVSPREYPLSYKDTRTERISLTFYNFIEAVHELHCCDEANIKEGGVSSKALCLRDYLIRVHKRRHRKLEAQTSEHLIGSAYLLIWDHHLKRQSPVTVYPSSLFYRSIYCCQLVV